MHGKKLAAQPVNTDVRLCFGKTKAHYGGSAIGEGLVFANLVTHVLSLRLAHHPPISFFFFLFTELQMPSYLGEW